MKEINTQKSFLQKPLRFWIAIAFVLIGFATFIYGVLGPHPERAWQAYLINFLLWSAMAQGAVLFSTVMHLTKARWSGPLAGLSESFSAFFPLSFVFFLLLFLGKTHLFPWLNEDLGGQEIWLNIPFLFWRDFFGLLILYGIGFGYLNQALQLKLDPNQPQVGIRKLICKRWKQNGNNIERIKNRMTIWGGLYILAFALVLSLIGYDLIMSMDPHWVSTLFGAYTFVKAFYIGLGALIILASVFYLRYGEESGLTSSHFHDIGKLFFAFSLLWADFFYVQLVVIWYGNISEEAYYVIERTMLADWNSLAWTVLILCFVLPFIVLLNKKVKTKPIFMIPICVVVIIGIWLEHLLLLGPALSHNSNSISLGVSDGLIFLGFFGVMAIAVTYFLRQFPELVRYKEKKVA
ncbi:MAG TPA: hypothetical protein ENI07_10565 [Desulfobacterales bacterium]|nr:hypothetical protein [Desulfobacterales bacterium]